jgi:hypothetical protein
VQWHVAPQPQDKESPSGTVCKSFFVPNMAFSLQPAQPNAAPIAPVVPNRQSRIGPQLGQAPVMALGIAWSMGMPHGHWSRNGIAGPPFRMLWQPFLSMPDGERLLPGEQLEVLLSDMAASERSYVAKYLWGLCLKVIAPEISLGEACEPVLRRFKSGSDGSLTLAKEGVAGAAVRLLVLGSEEDAPLRPAEQQDAVDEYAAVVVLVVVDQLAG